MTKNPADITHFNTGWDASRRAPETRKEQRRIEAQERYTDAHGAAAASLWLAGWTAQEFRDEEGWTRAEAYATYVIEEQAATTKTKIMPTAAWQCPTCARWFDRVGIQRHECPERQLQPETATAVDGPMQLCPATRHTFRPGKQTCACAPLPAKPTTDVDDRPRPAAGTETLVHLAEAIGPHRSALTNIDDLTSIIEQAEKLRELAVAQARLDGHSWTKIGQQLGTTKQGAQKRYSERPTETVDAAQTMIEL